MAASEVTLKVGSEVSMKLEGIEFLCGTVRVYDRVVVGVVGVIGGLIGDSRRSVESPSEGSEA